MPAKEKKQGVCVGILIFCFALFSVRAQTNQPQWSSFFFCWNEHSNAILLCLVSQMVLSEFNGGVNYSVVGAIHFKIKF